jgi:RND family efflux transporter MFP subunit
MTTLRRFSRFAVYGALLVTLVLALLWFQGLIGRPDHDLHEVPEGGVPVGTTPGRPGSAGVATPVVRSEAPLLHLHPAHVEAIDPARIAARVMAVVREVSVREGDEVAAGAPLVQLDDTDAVARRAQARAALEAADARITAADLAFDRAERLQATGSSTAQAFESAQAERDAARATGTAAREALAEAENALAWHHITAPFAGRVLSREVERGDLAQPGRVLVSLYRPDALRVVAALPERYAAELQAGALLSLEFAGLAPLVRPATRVLPMSDAATGTVTVHIDLDAEPSAGEREALHTTLRPGVLGRVGVPTGTRARLVVPAGAIERIGQVERAWLVREGHAQAVNVRTVPAEAGLVEVLSGLVEGDTVLVR